MSKQVYSDSQRMIAKLLNDDKYEIIVECYKDSGRLVAGLFDRKKE